MEIIKTFDGVQNFSPAVVGLFLGSANKRICSSVLGYAQIPQAKFQLSPRILYDIPPRSVENEKKFNKIESFP